MIGSSSKFNVGEVVRVPRPNKSRGMGRATVATIQDDETVCVLWESIAQKPLSPSLLVAASDEKKAKRRLKRSFLVTPSLIETSYDDTKEIETIVPLSEVKPLLDFEQNRIENQRVQSQSGPHDIHSTIAMWKERGDQLLRLGDASAACCYYEAALALSSILQVGSAVIVKLGGHAKVADVDCLDDDNDNIIEISMADAFGEEKVVKESEILLCILFNDDEDHTQERILLNLVRCLLQLAELAKQETMTSRPEYLRSAVLAATLALTIAEYHKEKDGTLTNLEQTALLLRSQAQAGLAKFHHAVADAKRLLSVVPQHKEGLKRLQSLQGQQQRQKQVDKKLVKSMCQWVKTAASSDPVSSQQNQGESKPSQTSGQMTSISCSSTPVGNDPTNTPKLFQNGIPKWVFYLVPLFIAFFLQQLGLGGNT
jgi:hypothetical protein